MMKIAVSGKGGSGKTTVAAGLINILLEEKKSVIAVDCDPDISLGLSLGFPDYAQIKPISEMKELISERTESDPLKTQGFFKINPKIDDIPEKFCPEYNGVRLIVIGKVDKPGGGCLCPENTFIRSLIARLILREDEVVVLDMAAGSEHLGRATAKAVDIFLIVVEPSQMSVDTSRHIKELAEGLGIRKVSFIGNKIKDKSDTDFIEDGLNDRVIGNISFSNTLAISRGKFAFDDKTHKELRSIYANINS